MGFGGPALEFGMVLDPYVEGVFGELRRLHQPPVGGDAGEGEPGIGQLLSEFIVELVPVPMAFGDGVQGVLFI